MIDQPGFGEWSVPLIGVSSFIVWLWVCGRERDHLIGHEPLPVGIRDAAVVAILAASGLGTISALSFPHLISQDLAVMIAALWRASVLACGVYALIASYRDTSD